MDAGNRVITLILSSKHNQLSASPRTTSSLNPNCPYMVVRLLLAITAYWQFSNPKDQHTRIKSSKFGNGWSACKDLEKTVLADIHLCTKTVLFCILCFWLL